MSIAPAPVERPDYHERFAAVYDTFYRRRDVAGEVSLAVELLGLHDGDAGRRVLDFGCGTGSHVLQFARRGFVATGFDVSKAMVAEAKQKAARAETLPVAFAHGAFSAFCQERAGGLFDGGVSFFNVLNCLDSASGMVRDLTLLRRILAPGARMLLDVWNGAAVFAEEPRSDVRHFMDDDDPEIERIRITIPTIDRIEQRCTLRYRVLTLHRGDGRFSEFESLHKLHFLTPTQYRHLFELSGLTILDEFPEGNAGTPISDRDWYISYLLAAPE